MLFENTLVTTGNSFFNISPQTMVAVRKAGIDSGVCIVYCPHTTAAVAISKNADTPEGRDILAHLEGVGTSGGESAAVRAALVGSSVHIIVREGKLLLGPNQNIQLYEFAGANTRKFYVKVIKD